MKCIRIVGQGVPVRLSDDDALQVVDRDGDGEYCPKKQWYDQNETRRAYNRIGSEGRLVELAHG